MNDIRHVARLLGLQGGKGERANFRCFNTAGHKNGDQNPSLSISNGFYYCHGCGIKGSTVSLVQNVKGCTISEAKEWLESVGVSAQWYTPGTLPEPSPLPNVTRLAPAGVSVPVATRKAYSSIWKRCDPDGENVAALEERKGMLLPFRQITEEAVSFHAQHREAFAKHGISYLHEGSILMSYRHPELLEVEPDVPDIVLLRERVVGLTTGARFFTYGSVQLYIPEPIPENPEMVFLCEGETDTHAAIASGYHAIGLPGAVSAIEKAVAYIALRYPSTCLVTAFDDDEAGKKATLRVLSLRRHLPPGLSIVRFQHVNGQKDLSEAYQAFGAIIADESSATSPEHALRTLRGMVRDTFNVAGNAW